MRSISTLLVFVAGAAVPLATAQDRVRIPAGYPENLVLLREPNPKEVHPLAERIRISELELADARLKLATAEAKLAKLNVAQAELLKKKVQLEAELATAEKAEALKQQVDRLKASESDLIVPKP